MSKTKEPISPTIMIIAYALSFLFSSAIIGLTHWISPGLIPLTMSDIWNTHGTGFGEWMITSLPLLLWGVFISVIINGVRGQNPYGPDSTTIFVQGTVLSILAGVLEEVSHRWLSFLAAIGVIAVVNWLLGGFIFSMGLPQVLHVYVWGHVANFTTFGMLEGWIFHPSGWLVGAAMLYSNAAFRDGHKYQGWFGWINSWFLGMYLFYLMFNHGLLAAILAHFAYDMVIFTVKAIFARR